MKTSLPASAWRRIMVPCGAAILACGDLVRAGQEQALPSVLTKEQMAYIDAKDEAQKRILGAAAKRAKLLFMEQQQRGTVLAFAIPQPKAEEIQGFLVPLKEFIATTTGERARAWAREQIVRLSQHHGFREGKLRAVYLLIPSNREQALELASFPAETEQECEKFIREDVKPIKREIGKSYQARAGMRATTLEIHKGWDGEALVKGRGLDAQLENWVNWHRKRAFLK